MKKSIVLALFLLPALVFAQENKGMHFVKGLSWAQIREKAKQEKKPIMMDCFTTWCGPCKYMDAKIFPTEEAGTFFNEKFILVKAQIDTSASDNEDVKKWYQDAHDIANQYKIRAYPTYLFFNSDGELVHRAVGSVPAPADFIARGNDALDPTKQYYTLLKKYEGGENSPEFLRQFSLAALSAYDIEKAYKVSDEYLETLKDPYTKDNIDYVVKFAYRAPSKGLSIIMANPAKVDEIEGKKIADQLISSAVMNEQLSKLFARNAPPADWSMIHAELQQKYPSYADELEARLKVYYFQNKKDWNSFQPAIIAYMEKYGAKVSESELNNFAWTVFENCPDMNCVTQALDWSKRSFASSNNPMFIDTYANILYKMGKKDDALLWEKKAVDLADNDSKKDYQTTLEKMQKGEKTWNND